MRKCNTVADCLTVETACCSCNMGGKDSTKSVINKTYYNSFTLAVSNYCTKTNQKYCTALYNCFESPVLKCVNNLCTTNIVPETTTTTTTSTTTTTKPTYQ
jgi:3-hydroxy-3-methylglutaryl CoA synthase